MLKNPPSAILFDLDGTIADTALDLTATLNHLLTRHGRKAIEHNTVRHMVGQGARALIIKGFSHTGDTPSESEVDKLFDDYLAYYLDHISDESELFEGFQEVLTELYAQKIPLAVCTNKNAALTNALLDDLNISHYFSAITCGDSFDYKKPDPRHLYSTCDLMNADPQKAIMVGDSINDIAAAKAANILSIGVTFGYTETPMSELGADIVIDHFDEFLDALSRLTARH